MNSLCSSIFSKTIPAYVINIYRLLFCLSIAGEVFYEKNFWLQKVSQSERFPVNIFFRYINISEYGVYTFQVLIYFLILTLVFAAIGLLTRLALFASLMLFFICVGEVISHRFSMHKDYLPWNQSIVVFNILVLLVSPKISRYGLDHWLKSKLMKENKILKDHLSPYWPVFLLQFHLVISYFAGGIVKLKNIYFWGNGYTLQKYFLGTYMMLDLQSALWLTQNFYILILLGVGTLLIEILFPLALWSKRFAFFALISTLIVQIYFYLKLDLLWMHYYGWSYWIYLILFYYYWTSSRRDNP